MTSSSAAELELDPDQAASRTRRRSSSNGSTSPDRPSSYVLIRGKDYEKYAAGLAGLVTPIHREEGLKRNELVLLRVHAAGLRRRRRLANGPPASRRGGPDRGRMAGTRSCQMPLHMTQMADGQMPGTSWADPPIPIGHLRSAGLQPRGIRLSPPATVRAATRPSLGATRIAPLRLRCRYPRIVRPSLLLQITRLFPTAMTVKFDRRNSLPENVKRVQGRCVG